MPKRNQLSLRLDDIELARLHALSAKLGIGAQETLRLVLKRETDRLASSDVAGR